MASEAPESLLDVPADAVPARELVPAAVPAAWVLDGSPQARTLELAHARAGTSVGQWDCTAGRFHWHFGGCEEIIHVLEGEVTVTSPRGEVHELVVGDAFVFPSGTRWTWEVPTYVRKAYVIRPTRRHRATRAARALARKLLRR